ncbi:hypothetical protein SAMN04488564_111201 [Lentzea waywayandensis]|uniref:PH domain-containing protein n=1 Tax=Lentzea waywayandensis TaxID=84724 RepID=A0A1I6FCZ7_9PSEU|nr:hypothetical protein [Lentzea waywayandensis]SFR27733.1 hypothetical protein SAMN04488564_111201 [Lentzea waywayandensis]
MSTLRSTHPVDTGRRRVLGRVTLIIALVSAALLTLMFVIDLGGAQYGLIFAAFPFLITAPASVVLLRKARRPEVIELHEDGIAHVLGGVRRSWAWDEVRAIDVAERGEYSYTGSDVDCTVRFADGTLLHFNGLTENSRAIIGALGTHCLDATREPVHKKHKARAAAILGTITLVGGGVATWAVLTVPTTAEGGDQFGLAMLAVACTVPAVISLILLISVLVTGRR